MKIAVPVTAGNQIDEHFGHCEFYNVYTVATSKEIAEVQRLEATQGCGCKSNIAAELSAMGVTLMLAGGIGAGAINVLNQCGIDVIRGCSGAPEVAVGEYLKGLLTDSGESCRQHDHHHAHGHEHGHNCSH